MKIEVWSDFVCPFCYIGKRRLEEALEQFPHKENVEVIFRSYELDPNTPKNVNMTVNEALAEKYGMTIEKAKEMSAGVAEQAASVGLDFHFEQMINANTFDAHRLAHYGAEKGVDLQLTEALLKANFTETKNLNSHEVLAEIAKEVGLDAQEVLFVLQDEKKYANTVKRDQMIAQQMGVRGVPFFVLNEKYSISGAQPSQTFLGALEKVWAEENQEPVLQDLSVDQDASCGDDGCAIPTKE